MKPAVKIDNLQFAYGRDTLFNGLTLAAGPGLYGVLGKNGAGKSSMLKIIAGQLYRDGGNCITLGEDPAARRPDLLSRLFYLPEDIYLPPMKGTQYRILNAPFYPGFDEGEFLKALELFEVPVDKKLNTLSYGQKKKFLIAFAVATDCPLLLLDEPTNGLDIPSKSQFRQVMAGLDLETRTVLISTHQVRDMEMLIDPIVIVDKGKIILNHTMEEINGLCHTVQQDSEPRPGEALYWEKNLGGWTVVKPGPGKDDRNMDLELLFNLTIANGPWA